MPNTVGFLGSHGSYSHQAATIICPDGNYTSFSDFEDLVRSTENGDVSRSVLPIENSSSGRIPDVHRLISTMELFITAEYLLPVDHVLATTGPCDERDIHTLYSHPQGFIQTSEFLSERFPEVSKVAKSDTATAIKEMVEESVPGVAAIGSEFAAQMYSATVLHKAISNRSDNITRFVAVEREAVFDSDHDMTSLIIQVSHEPGSLVAALAVFGHHGVNITKLETYMISETTKLPTFYLDLGCGSEDERVKKSMKDLEDLIHYFKFLGSYKSHPNRSGINGFLKP